MKIHEYQAKDLFHKYQIPIQAGKVIFNAEEAPEATRLVSNVGPWVVKAQIHAGGRGKGGGVKFAKTIEDVKSHAREILGMQLVTPQTGPEGRRVERVLITQSVDISKEYYLAITLDRTCSKLVIIASLAGGMDIEAVAKNTPEKIFKEWIDPFLGLRDFQCRRLGMKMGFAANLIKEFGDILKRLTKLYLECDCSLAEINPLVLNQQQHLLAVDAKINFDDNSLFRHPSFNELIDTNEEDPNEQSAKKFDLNYISLDGNIGCMVNGAGLAMATMDIIKLEGGNPANFLDVGGGASEEKVREAFKILISDAKVKAILVNIFGGIMKCDVIAAGIVAAAKQLKLKVPLVIRLEGTNVEAGKKILKDSGIAAMTANGMQEAAKRVVEAARLI